MPDNAAAKFEPDWCIHPGEHVRDFLDSLPGVTPRMFAKIAGIDEKALSDLLACKRGARITRKVAHALSRGFATVGATPSDQFWLNLDRNYRDALKRGATDMSDV